MKIAFIIFDQMTALDFVGFHDPITRLKTMCFLPALEWKVCARSKSVRDGAGLEIRADEVAAPLGDYDLIFVPGGFGTRTLKDDPEFIDWIRTAFTCQWKMSVCTGALILGAAGFLEGKSATTHPAAHELLLSMVPGAVRERIVEDGEVITGGGVSSSIDLGLYLCEKFAGTEARAAIQKQMDYPYQAPPPWRPDKSLN